MSASSPATFVPPPEPPELVSSNVRAGVRLISSAVVFLFMAFVFAFLYLKTLNSNHLFRPADVSAPQGFGVAILVCVLLCAGVFQRARAAIRQGADGAWRTASIGAVALAVAVLVLQIVEYLGLSFKTASGGYASVFWGWTLVYLLSWLGGLYWMETLLAQTLRGGEEPTELMRSSADGCVVYLYTLAGIEIVGYILLYLVK